MAAVKTLALCAVIVVAGAPAQAGTISWRWTSWAPGQGMLVTNVTDPSAGLVSVAPVAVAAAPAPAVSGSDGWQSQGRWATTSPVATYTPPSTPPQAASTYDAYINLDGGPYPGASTLTSGNAQPWYDSPVVTQLYGGVPNAQQRADFSNTILQRVEQTYQSSGVPLQATNNSAIPAAHTLSVVSGTSYAANPNAVGITNVGSDGFSFIDKFGAAQSVDQLEWAVAHNVAHELMHAFGGDHMDKTGTYLDSALTPWSLMIDPNAKFSPAEVQALLSMNFKVNTARDYGFDGQELSGVPVPEPASTALWVVAGTALVAVRRNRSSRAGV
jgi:hypothetical protein